MDVPIISDGPACVGKQMILTACCPSDRTVIWDVLEGAQNIALTPNGHTATVDVIQSGGFKIRAQCCKD